MAAHYSILLYFIGKTNFILKKLKPDAEYFLQVEAYSQFGKERLKSETGNLAFNTTNYKNGSYNWNSAKLVLKRAWLKFVDGELKARVTWSGCKYSAGSIPKFIITWRSTTPCKSEKTEMSATTHNTYYDLSGLQLDCKYSVHVKEIGLGYVKSKAMFFSTNLRDDRLKNTK